ncbi:MAG: hypothetical protein M1833_001596 [Piccolia ochrophora]|nr:MAG: hypothetical protein M1833_001596 [Piccolia ochrophora]
MEIKTDTAVRQELAAGADPHTEKAIFDHLLWPDDSYDKRGIYWADMGLAQRFRFITRTNNAEAKRELANIWRMTKADPLSPITAYFRNYVVPGAGLGLEGYVLFSIGNVKPLFQKVWPACWKAASICDPTWISSVEYLEICGIILGQILVGILGDWFVLEKSATRDKLIFIRIGRRWGLIQDASIMLLGLVMLTASWGTSLNGWVICYSWSLFFYGIGVGGEYPMTATSSMENATGSGKISTREDRLHRGRKTTSAFLMQGWGQILNQVLLILLLLMFHHGSGNPPYSTTSTQWVFRISFAIPAIGTLGLVYYRAYRMKFASKQLTAAKDKAHVTGYDFKSLRLTFTYFGTRVFATAGAWFANDVFFYGNKLFQEEFISVISPNNKSVMEGWLWNLVNVGVSLIGYYLACESELWAFDLVYSDAKLTCLPAFLIDNKLYGRKCMQIVGFMADFVLFIIPAFNFSFYTEPANIASFQAMYFLSSFFNQFGPNAVTFLVAAEVFPTPIRATAHGFSAAMGKLGALLASVLYNYIDTQTKFYVVPWFGLFGALVTWLFLPDTTGLDLKEQERRWQYIRSGHEADYHGVAVHPKHLSVWERLRGAGKHYDANLDYRQRIEEMREQWEESMKEKYGEDGKLRFADDVDDTWSPDISAYFETTRGLSAGIATHEKPPQRRGRVSSSS